MSVSAYDKYILAHPTEPVEFKKIVLFSTMPMDEKQHIKANLGRMFIFCDDPDSYLTNHLLSDMPTLFWDRQTLIEKYGIAEANMQINAGKGYNATEGILVSKLDTLKLLQRTKFAYIPETYYTKEDAEKNLEFPLIAKASNTFQSRGVEKINNAKELKALSKGFNIFQQQINIHREYRVVFFRGKRIGIAMIGAFQRNPRNEKAKDLRTNEGDGDGMKFQRLMNREKSNFSWTQFNPYYQNVLSVEECYKIASHIFAINPTLNVTGLDIAVDDQGKHWFIESNSTPGLFSNMVPLIYKFIYEDYYGPLSVYAQRRLRDMSHYFAQLTMEDEPTFSIQGNGAHPNEYILNHIDGFLPQFC